MNKSPRCSIYLTLISISLLSGCTWFTYKTGEQMTFPNNNYKLYKQNVTGSSYGWKFLLLLPVATPSYADALTEIWDRTKIPLKDRKYYRLVNLTENWGTSWTAIIIGQNYLKLNGDIIESKNMPRSWHEYDFPATTKEKDKRKIKHWYDYKN